MYVFITVHVALVHVRVLHGATNCKQTELCGRGSNDVTMNATMYMYVYTYMYHPLCTDT